MHDWDGQVWLDQGKFLIVPRGVEISPVVEEEVHVLLFEPATDLNTGEVQEPRTVRQPRRIRTPREDRQRERSPGTKET
jgi:hypothetical protein